MLKLKFPKTILIGDTNFKVKTDKKRNGGEFYYWDDDEKKKNKKKGGCIIIGTCLLNINPIEVLTTIIHELKEVIQVEQCVRFVIPRSSSSYLFNYNHEQHTDFCSRLAGLLSQFIK